jgi:hypothetical protein
MIAFLDDHPLVKLQDGQMMVFERRWLELALQRAARAAGYESWWLANDVVESVSQYLQADFSETVVATERLELTVQAVLQSIGYADIAAKFQSFPPPARISLLALAHQAGHKFDMLFFQLLRGALQEVLGGGAVQIELSGLSPAVKHLRQAKYWRRDCSILRAEVVQFIQRESKLTAEQCPGREFHLQIQ